MPSPDIDIALKRLPHGEGLPLQVRPEQHDPNRRRHEQHPEIAHERGRHQLHPFRDSAAPGQERKQHDEPDHRPGHERKEEPRDDFPKALEQQDAHQSVYHRPPLGRLSLELTSFPPLTIWRASRRKSP